MEINNKEYVALCRLRDDRVAPILSELKRIIIKYYPFGTEFVVSGNGWYHRVKENEE